MRDVVQKPALFVVAFILFTLVVFHSTGSSDATTQEGCLNQWLFNGVWRVQVTKVDPLMDGAQQVGWQITQVWRNGTTQEIAPGDSVLQDQKLELKDGSSILATSATTSSMSLSAIANHSFQAASQFTFVQIFRAANLDPSNKPIAVNVLFDAAKLAQLHNRPQFTSHQYNFRFKLDCVASGGAAQAQGGATQVAAIPGCMNEWLSNGIWRVRVTAVGPDLGNDNSGPQIGWMATEDWTNLASRPLAPGDANATDQQITLAGGNTIASSNSAGTSMNMQQLTYRTFAPGSSFTYQQRFRQAPLDASDKPVKLLFTFNAKAQNQNPNAPHYKNPADFRIDLTCTK